MEQRTAVQSDEAVSHFRVPNCFLYRGKRTQIAGRFLLDTSLSSSPFLANSSRHSLTSRIECNSRAFYHLIFSSRHLNATPEKRKNVEKFNICIRFFAAPAVSSVRKCARTRMAPQDSSPKKSRRKDLGNFAGIFHSGFGSHFRAGGSRYSETTYDP